MAKVSFICRESYQGLVVQKSKGRIFIKPQIRELMNNQNFERSLNESEKAAWRSFQKVVKKSSETRRPKTMKI
jgi:hypothetical protein